MRERRGRKVEGRKCYDGETCRERLHKKGREGTDERLQCRERGERLKEEGRRKKKVKIEKFGVGIVS